MKNILINATSNFKNIRFSGVENHVERNYKSDRNKSINLNLTSQNLNLSQANTLDLLKNHYHDLIVNHDKKCGKKHANRKYHNLNGFLKHKKGSPTKMVVTKFGTYKDKKELLKLAKDNPNKIHNANNYGFYLYCSNFNQRHKYIKMGKAISNVDEKGADHIHWELIPLGHTPKGKASMGLSNALRNEYHTNNRIKAMKLFHSVEDPELIKDMNKSYHKFKLLPFTANFKLSRTGKSWGLSEKVFERSKIEEDKINHNLRKSNSQLKKVIYSALKQNESLANRVSSLMYQNRKYEHQGSLLDADSIDILRGLPSDIRSWQRLLEIDKSYQRSNHLSALKGQRLRHLLKTYSRKLDELDTWRKTFQGLEKSNKGWYPEWNKVKNNLKVLKGIRRLSPQLRKALIDLSNGQNNSLKKYLTDLLVSAKKGQKEQNNSI